MEYKGIVNKSIKEEKAELIREAAPDLLEALENIIQTAENWAVCCEINGEGENNPAAVAVRHAKQAIAKAKGLE
jgi:hypothetical protein